MIYIYYFILHFYKFIKLFFDSKIFSKTMLNVKPGSVNVSFDMMQNQPIPKLSVTDTFYSR